MRISLRPALGVTAAAASAALVLLAALTAPSASPALHASAKCPDEAKELSPLPAPEEAQRPA